MVGPNYTVYLVKRGYDYYEPQRFRLNGSSENFLNWEWTADLLPALKGEDSSGLFIGSPIYSGLHLSFGGQWGWSEIPLISLGFSKPSS